MYFFVLRFVFLVKLVFFMFLCFFWLVSLVIKPAFALFFSLFYFFVSAFVFLSNDFSVFS